MKELVLFVEGRRKLIYVPLSRYNKPLEEVQQIKEIIELTNEHVGTVLDFVVQFAE